MVAVIPHAFHGTPRIDLRAVRAATSFRNMLCESAASFKVIDGLGLAEDVAEDVIVKGLTC